MKIGIASCYFHHNYGSMLQAYATQKFIQKNGYEVTTIHCLAPIQYMTQSKLIYYFHKFTQIDTVFNCGPTSKFGIKLIKETKNSKNFIKNIYHLAICVKIAQN